MRQLAVVVIIGGYKAEALALPHLLASKVSMMDGTSL
jgi:hypothetical protein